ncbi:MAG TPA: ABC transporter ATP-binding protein [Streptosporangiaceae bacterium]
MNAITVEHLVKRYGRFTAVHDVSFEVPAGQVTALLGPNGAGKTTIVEILEGFARPTSGSVRVLGKNPQRAGRAWRARIGLVLQSTSLDEQLTVAEAISLFGALYPRPVKVGEVLEMTGLRDDAGTKVGALSGGQRRRADVALGIVGRPELLFLDEPTTGLDPEARRHLWTVIENLTAAGTTVLLTTHYMDEAQYLARSVIVLAGGRVVADATPDQLRARSGAPVIRFRFPAGVRAADLPPRLASHLEPGARLTLPSGDVAADLGTLISWATASQADLTGLEIGPPSLEDAYLALTGHPDKDEVTVDG